MFRRRDPDPQFGLDMGFDLGKKVGRFLEEFPYAFAALSQAFVAVGEPRTAFLDA